MAGRNTVKLNALRSSIHGQSHRVHSVDYLDRAAGQLSDLGELDGIVLITPRPGSNPASTPPADEWRDLFDCGFIGPLELLRQALPSLKQNARIVIVSGITSVQYYPTLPQFAVLRSMWLAEAKALSNELGERGISVNTLSLGGIWTKKLAKKIAAEAERSGSTPEDLRSQRIQNIPLKKYAELSEIDHVVEQMLGETCSHITGQNIVLDGGFTSVY
jgi:3-oxoacyl-[acyl-carrier protein] reductase